MDKFTPNKTAKEVNLIKIVILKHNHHFIYNQISCSGNNDIHKESSPSFIAILNTRIAVRNIQMINNKIEINN